MAIEIRLVYTATDKLMEALDLLLPQLSGSDTQLDQKAVAQKINASNCHFFTAKDTESTEPIVIGTVSLITLPLLTGITARIEDLVVDKPHRGRGIGKALVHEAIKQASRLHASFVDLTSHPSRGQANQLYRGMGFLQRDTNIYRYTLSQAPGDL